MNTSLEDYLKNIYSLHITSGKATTTMLADKMNVTPSAISEMIAKLSRSGYIKNVPYKGFELTKKGKTIALNLTRKHRLWEVFLLKYLKFPWDLIHQEAENLEHASSDELISRLESFLGFPKFDPHGHPIPDNEGNIVRDKTVPVSNLNVGDVAIIKQVSDESSEILAYLTKAGLKLDDEIKVIEKIVFDKSIKIHFKSGKMFLSEKLSKNIFVNIGKKDSRIYG